jgi:hypothetical protein
MQSRPAVAEVLRVVARQHTRLRGLLHEVALSSETDRTRTTRWLSDYLLLHVAAEQVALCREPAIERGSPAARWPLVELAQGLDPTEPGIHRRLDTLEAALLRHARAQERSVLPRMLRSWPLDDLHYAAVVLEAADIVFDRGPAEPAVTGPSAVDSWHSAIGDILAVATLAVP